MTPTKSNLLNLVLFQVFWFVCVMGGDVAAGIGLTIYTFIYCRWIGNPREQWKGLLAISMCGLLVDIAISASGVIHFSNANGGVIWLICLWIGFSTLFYHGLHWLSELPLPVVALIGAIAGPLTYLGGASLNDSPIAVGLMEFFIWYGVAWSMLLPLITHMPRLAYSGEISR